MFQAADYHCQEIGKVAYVTTVPPDLIPLRRAVQQSIDEMAFFERVISGVQKKSKVSTSVSAQQREGILYRAKTELKNAKKYAQHCRVVLGRECIFNSFCPPGANQSFDKAVDLLAKL